MLSTHVSISFSFQASPTRELRSQANIPGCLSSEGIKGRKGDFVLQTGHIIEIVTKLFLVIQNATGKPPHVNVASDFEANFCGESVKFSFKRSGHAPHDPSASGGHHNSHVKLVKKGNKMEITL